MVDTKEKTFFEESHTEELEMRERIAFRGSYRSHVNVQAHINNCKGIPTTIEQLYEIQMGYWPSDIEWLLYSTEVCWSVPRWAKTNDIVFFMIQKDMPAKISKLRRELISRRSEFDIKQYIYLMSLADRYVELIKKYHGKIIAIGRVDGVPYNEGSIQGMHGRSSISADISDLTVLKNPVDISEFNDFIRVSRQSAITGVFGSDFYRLREIIGSKNDLPEYIKKATVSLLPYRDINRHTWLNVANEYRRSFMLEEQFRKYYVDYLLHEIRDSKSSIYEECACRKGNNPITFVDNVIKFNGKFLMVEVKLNILLQTNMKVQANQYCNVDSCTLNSKAGNTKSGNQFYENNVLIIDTEKVYMYNSTTDDVSEIFELDRLHVKEDIAELRRLIEDMLQ